MSTKKTEKMMMCTLYAFSPKKKSYASIYSFSSSFHPSRDVLHFLFNFVSLLFDLLFVSVGKEKKKLKIEKESFIIHTQKERERDEGRTREEGGFFYLKLAFLICLISYEKCYFSFFNCKDFSSSSLFGFDNF